MPLFISTSRVALIAALSLGACGRGPEAGLDEASLNLTEVVAFQQHQVSTDLISVPEGIGLEQIGYGWWQETDDTTQESWLRLATEVGQLRIFSADGDLDQIEVEFSGNGSSEPQPKIRIRLNGEQLERVPAPDDWIRLKIDVPTRLAQQGVNRLEFNQPVGKSEEAPDLGSQMRLRRVRIRSRSGRKLWPAKPQRILVAANFPATEDGPGALVMPVASYLEVVLALPEAAWLQGDFVFEPEDRTSKEPILAYVELLDDTGSEQTLYHERFYKRTRHPERLRIDLAAWAGKQVRLRIGATGAGNGVIRWQHLGLSAAEPVALTPSLPPITRKMAPRSGKMQQPDVVVVLLDAARADAFSPWGGPHPTPAVERLAKDGTVFASATSPAPWTGQSVPSIMTGLLPDTLGVGPWGSQLPDEPPTLAELMTGAGYRTVLWSQHPLYSNHKSFRRGFQEFYRTPRGAYDSVPGRELLTTDDQPTFTFVHVIPPHAPYTPPAPFRGAYSAWYEGKMSVDAARLNSYPRRRDPESLPEEDRRYAFDRYLENAAFADDLVGRILDVLSRAGRYEDALIVVLSDHGEAFLEHQNFLHTNTVHREMLHVPFVVKWPRSAGLPSSVFESPVSLIDLVPTLVDSLTLDDQGHGFQGISLLPAAIESIATERAIYAITRGGHGPQRPPRTRLMLEVDGWRLLCSPDRGTLKLYRSQLDPQETKNLASEHPLQALLLRQAAISQWHGNRHLLHAGGAIVEKIEDLDPEVMEELEALGYLD